MELHFDDRGIPADFSLSRYHEMHNMGIADWASCLEIRSAYLEYIRYLTSGFSIGSTENNRIPIYPDYEGAVSSWLSRLIKNPLMRPSASSEESNNLSLQSLLKEQETVTISSLRTMDLYSQMIAHDNHIADAWKEVKSACEAYEIGQATPEQEALATRPLPLFYQDLGISVEGLVEIRVDFNATDAQIMSDFSKWLCDFRKVMRMPEQKNTYTPRNLSRWTDLLVLPYIDLYMCSRFRKKPIPQHVIGEILFPNETDVDTTERVRKVVHPLAMRLLEPQLHRALAAQALAEMSIALRPE